MHAAKLWLTLSGPPGVNVILSVSELHVIVLNNIGIGWAWLWPSGGGPSFPFCFSVLVSLTSSFLFFVLKKKMHLHSCTSSHQSTDTLPSICLFLPRPPYQPDTQGQRHPSGAAQCRCRHRGRCGGSNPGDRGGNTALRFPASPPAHLQGGLQHQEARLRKRVQQGGRHARAPPHPQEPPVPGRLRRREETHPDQQHRGVRGERKEFRHRIRGPEETVLHCGWGGEPRLRGADSGLPVRPRTWNCRRYDLSNRRLCHF